MKTFLLRLYSTIPFLITLPFILLILYSVRFDLSFPHDGMDWARISGEVQSVVPHGPSSGLIRPGDVILEIDGVPIDQSSPLYQGKQAGDTITFGVQRGDERLNVEVQLSEAPVHKRIQRLTPHFVALTFLLIGISIKAFSPTTLTSTLFFLLCLLASGALSAGSISAVGPSWASKFFNILVWWIGPATVHLHLHFPQDVPKKFTYILHPILYITAILGSAPYIILKTSTLQDSTLLQPLLSLGRLALAINLIIAVGLLLYAYLRPRDPETRHKVRIVTLFGVIAFLLVISLTLLPSVLIFSPILPYEYSLLPLVLIPLSYGYAIYRYRLIDLEKHIRRAATYALILVVLSTVLVGILAGIKDSLPLTPGNQVIVIVALTILFSAAFAPVQRQLQKLVDFFLYGGWYDYRSAVERLTGGLENFTHQAQLGNEITRRLRETLKPEYALLLLCSVEEHMSIYPENLKRLPSSVADSLQSVRRLNVSSQGALCQYFYHHRQDLNHATLEDELSAMKLTPSEEKLVDFLMGKFPIPITDKDTIVGIFLLGPKIGGEAYSGEDLNILTIVSRQIGVSIQNVRLLDEVRRRALEVDKLHQEIVRAREEEQKRLARELHDEIIQALVGLNYHLSHLQVEGTDQAKGEVRAIIQNLRRITAELRPPALDTLGLVSAIRSSVRRASTDADLSMEIYLNIEGDESQEIPEEVATILYRVFAESFNNALVHAQAKRVEVDLDLQPDQIGLEVRDDGTGFEVPERLGNLLEDHHFGLVGIRERVELVRGSFKLTSEAGKGTRLLVRIPISAVEGDLVLERNLN